MDLVKSLNRWNNRLVAALYRGTRGRIGIGRILLLTVRGRRSGTPRTVPLAFFDHEGSMLVVGSHYAENRTPVVPQPPGYRVCRGAARADSGACQRAHR